MIESVKDIFLTIFFASVGMRVYPTFLYDNALLLLALTVITIVIKYLATMLVSLDPTRHTTLSRFRFGLSGCDIQTGYQVT